MSSSLPDLSHNGNRFHVSSCFMKVRNSLKSLKNKPGAQVVRRHGKVFVINKKEPRFKARQR
jgi:large subunit ribosomal protein L36